MKSIQRSNNYKKIYFQYIANKIYSKKSNIFTKYLLLRKHSIYGIFFNMWDIFSIYWISFQCTEKNKVSI